MDQEKALNDLDYIRSVMEGVRRRNVIDGVYYIVWGIFIPFCTLMTRLVLAVGRVNLIGIIWSVGMLTGAVVCYLIGRMRSRSDMNEKITPESRLYYTAWIGFGVTSILVMVVGWGFEMLGLTQGLFILGLLLALVYGIDGSFSGLKGLWLISLGWLIVGTVGLWLSDETASMVFGMATIPLELVPGIVLTRIYRREHHGRA